MCYENGLTGKEQIIRCKYLIGADGGSSFVRRVLNIPFDGSTTEDKWVRIDGVIETDMPKQRTYFAIESPTHWKCSLSSAGSWCDKNWVCVYGREAESVS